jgi:hypothetical protein
MKDFPMFTTEFGVASLILHEIPYRGEAFILIQDTQQPEELLAECVSFCRICGAEKIYVRGHEIAENYPLHCIVYEMRGTAHVDETKAEHLWPVTQENVAQWRELMNEKMRPVDNSGTLMKKHEQDILSSGGAYFVHHEGQLLGAFWLNGDELLLLCATVPGAGERVMHTMMSLIPGQEMRLDVVSTNTRAIRLYEKLGFICTGEHRRGHRIQ